MNGGAKTIPQAQGSLSCGRTIAPAWTPLSNSERSAALPLPQAGSFLVTPSLRQLKGIPSITYQ